MEAIAKTSQPQEFGLMVYHRKDGRRKFCVGSYENFATKYLSLHEAHRNFYELIREDAPAKLHVDIDILLQQDVELDPSSRTEALIKAITNGLKVLYNMDIPRDEVLQLDSSTAVKYSQHLIYPSVVFANNLQCGSFMKRLADSACEALDAGTMVDLVVGLEAQDLIKLFVPRSNGPNYFVCDPGVYTRNRHFRLWRSSKLGIESYLEIADENQYWASSAKAFFLDSLITHISGTSQQHLTCAQPANKVRPYTNVRTVVTSPANSTTPQLDEFVKRTMESNQRYRECSIASIVEYKDDNQVVYTISGTKWCEKVGREHSRNRPYFCANMRKGKLYQMCTSQGCVGYRSAGIDIPLDLQAKYVIGDEAELIALLDASDPMPVI